jgi:hypothetical protein
LGGGASSAQLRDYCARELEEVPMSIVGGLDIHREQLTFDYLDTVPGG